ncbi:double-strand-break repair protein rad21-like protein 1 isoform X2 [Anas platyrhynchos]|uniref:double-strand-break repair protein rad21-like protein 1 isoform X2 n=1 Tax=Anas platyrhynchos TaxID=8839 RepID=UPI0018D8CBEF|nr:double-strand-break repair protein rad21-like protein 1 isoform X2 [Anas platyrhynchos]
MFYMHLLVNKRGPLAKIWLAAHWEKKLTKAHIFECNLETTVENIISPKFTIALRTSGHLLLGVVRIYHRKAKYLLADCTEALTKMKTAFRPGLVDLPEESFEAAYQSITLPEEFHDFDTPLPDLNAIDVAEHFTLNRSRAEDITLTEDYESNILLWDRNFEILLRDEQNGLINDILDMEEELPSPQDLPENTTAFESNCEDTAIQTESHLMNETILLSKEDEGFVLAPVDYTAFNQRKKKKRKRKLLVDADKELSCSVIYNQLNNYVDILATLDLAPPTKKTMAWKESGGADTLLSNPTQSVVHAELQMFFATCFESRGFKMARNVMQVESEMEETRKEQDTSEMLIIEEPSSLQQSAHSETERKIRNDSFVMTSQSNRNETDNNFGEILQDATALSESSSFVNNSLGQEAPTQQAELNDLAMKNKNKEEIKQSKRTLQFLKTLQHLNKSGVNSFSLRELCQKNNRKEAAAKFYIFLVLKKQLVIELAQSAPFADITATAGRMFNAY